MVLVHVALWTQAVGVLAVGQEALEVVVGRRQDDAGGRGVAVGSVVVLVAVEASDALEEHVDGAQVGYEQVGVDVERLLERLGSDDDAASRLPALAEQLFYSLIKHCAVTGGESPVMERRYAFNVEQQARVAVSGEFLQRLLRPDGVTDGVADDEDLRAGAGGVKSALSCVGKVTHGRARLDGDRLSLIVFTGGRHACRRADGGVGGANRFGERGAIFPSHDAASGCGPPSRALPT